VFLEPTIAPAVLLHDVSVTYGAHRALSNVTATFPRGATGLLGSNGAGKSTLILAILGLVKLDRGRVEVLELDVAKSPLDARGRIGYVPERDAYIPGLSAISSVAYCGELAGLPPDDALQRAHEVLSYVGLDEGRYRYVETFSTGMKQRLKLAQALVHGPDLVLLDEPTNGMDPKGRDEMLALIADLGHAKNLSLIFSSHLLPDIERTCDSAVVLADGVVVASDRISEWRCSGSRTYEVCIKGDTAAFVGALKAAGLECDTSDGEIIHVVIPDGKPQAVFAIARRSGVQVRHLRPELPTLEDIFAQLTTRTTSRQSRSWTDQPSGV
jgi:ABC-2 type transport system ATP-binding protein